MAQQQMQDIINDLYKQHDETLFLTGFDLMIIEQYKQGGSLEKHCFKEKILQLHRKHVGNEKSNFSEVRE